MYITFNTPSIDHNPPKQIQSSKEGVAPLSPSLLAAHAWTAQQLYESTPSIDSRTHVMHPNHPIHYIRRGSPWCHRTPSSSSQRLSRFLPFLLWFAAVEAAEILFLSPKQQLSLLLLSLESQQRKEIESLKTQL
jgi:hypothetical protein